MLTNDDGEPLCDANGNIRYRYEPGDIRYNFLNYVTKPGSHTPLGYGPSTPDPDTGEIVSATVNIYGNWVDYVVTRALDLYDVVAGNTVSWIASVDSSGASLSTTGLRL